MAWLRPTPPADRLWPGLRRRTWSRWFKSCLGCLLLFSLPRPPQAADDASRSNRFLFIVETSRRMLPRAALMIHTVREILSSRLENQARPGDTIGIWTFNQELYAGFFPLQTWSPDANEAITLRAAEFLKPLKYSSQPSFERVVAELARLVKDSPSLTVILLSGPDPGIRGTPFDSSISAAHARWSTQQPIPKQLLVTVFHANHGRMTSFSVTPASFPIDLAPPPEDVAAKTAPEPFPKLPATPTPSSIPAESRDKTNPEPVQAVVTPPAPRSPIPLIAAGVPTAQQPQSPPPQPTVVQPPDLPSPIAPPSTNAPAFPKTDPAQPPPLSAAQTPVKAAAGPPPAPIAAPPLQAPPTPQPARPISADIEAGAHTTNRLAAPAPSPPPADLNPPHPLPNPIPTPTPAAVPVPRLGSEPAPMSAWGRISLWSGAVLGLAAIAAALFLIRRPRNAASSSLISRALERKRFEASLQTRKPLRDRPKP